MKKVIEKKSTKVLKLRHDIISLLYNSHNESIKLPSIRQLALDYGFAKATVQIMMEKLTKEGYIFSKKGIGFFTNPAKGFIFPGLDPLPLVGLIWGDGKSFYQDHFIWQELSSIGLMLTSHKINTRTLNINSINIENIAEEIIHSKLDGLVWLHPYKKHEDIFEKINSEIPLVTICNNKFFENINGLSFDYETYGRIVAETFILEKRSKVLLAISGEKLLTCLDSFRHTYVKAGIDYQEKLIENNPLIFFNELEEALSSPDPPEVLVTNHIYVEIAIKMMKKYNIDPNCQCRILSMGTPLEKKEAQVLSLGTSFEDIGNNVTDMMQGLLSCKGNHVEHRMQPLVIKNLKSSNIKKSK